MQLLDEKILQAEKMTFSNGMVGRLQIKERSYTITLDVSPNQFTNNTMHVAKHGIRVDSQLHKQFKRGKKIIITQPLVTMNQLNKDLAVYEDSKMTIEVTVRLFDVARKRVKDQLIEEVIASS